MTPHVDLAWRFAGRDDVYGYAGERPYCVKRPLTMDQWHGHITNGDPIGVYPLRADGMVHWGCSDFDTLNSADQARQVQAALKVMGIPSWPEISRSGGHHLWVFLPKNVWVPAAHMRYTLLLAHHIAEVPAKEVNPKQVLGSETVGNFVRIPYAGATLGQGRQVMLDRTSWEPLTLRGFLDGFRKTIGVAMRSQLTEHGNLWGGGIGRSEPTVPEAPAVYNGELKHLVKRLTNGAAVCLFRDGPLNGDRSEGLWTVANDAKRAGLTPSQALSLVMDAHDRWGNGKHAGPDTMEKLWRYYVGKAYL